MNFNFEYGKIKEKLRLIEAAAKIITEEIKSQVHELDTYSSSDNILYINIFILKSNF